MVDCSHEIKTHLLLGRKFMTNLDSILKNRDITLDGERWAVVRQGRLKREGIYVNIRN